MVNLKDFIGTATGINVPLQYIVDGIPMPDSTGKFIVLESSLANLRGGGFMIGSTPLISGALALELRPDLGPSIARLAVQFKISNSPSGFDVAYPTYSVIVDGAVSILKLVGDYPDMGPFTASVQRVDNGANTQIAASFQNFFDGATVMAKLVPVGVAS